MGAEDTLQYMADFYPDLFPTRKHALDHLFCLIGNGYEWVNGELVDNDDIYTKRYKLRKPIKKAFFEKEYTWCNWHYIFKEIANQSNKPMNPNYEFSWSEISKEYSYICNYPDNIKEDWLNLLKECQQLLKEDNIHIP